MIVLQLLAIILLIPLTILMLVIFNVCCTYLGYLLFVSLYMILYALTCALVFMNVNAAIWCGMSLFILYFFRMTVLVYQLNINKKENHYPVLRARFKTNIFNLYAILLFPFSFLSIVKILPDSITKKLSIKTGLNMHLSEWVSLVLDSSRGTLIEISHEDTYTYISIE